MDTDLEAQQAFFKSLENKSKDDLRLLLNNLKEIGFAKDDIERLSEEYYQYFENLKQDRNVVKTPKLLPQPFQGVRYRTCKNWVGIIPPVTSPINYLEIGVFYGGNIDDVEKLYASHDESKIYCIDPWENYADQKYLWINFDSEKTDVNEVYNTFLKNISHIQYKIEIRRGTSSVELPNLPNNFFDIIYIDGNHDYKFALEDANNSLLKLKTDGWLVFDDYDKSFKGVIEAVETFSDIHKTDITNTVIHNNQCFLQIKKNN
jgi:hypothetical protein